MNHSYIQLTISYTLAAGVPQAKQKSHKKKKREIDKLGMPSTTPSGTRSLGGHPELVFINTVIML